ncbi:MAG: hypothetical protein M3O25_08285 [Actinomycetota bacterium]|nr:hypothetical protein [Actinomycetota bacterium]
MPSTEHPRSPSRLQRTRLALLDAGERYSAITRTLAHDGPAMVEVMTDPDLV